jgi:hypothetical protein
MTTIKEMERFPKVEDCPRVMISGQFRSERGSYLRRNPECWNTLHHLHELEAKS